MAMRVTGMMSGMDTESIIQQLVAARQTKVDNLKKEQTKMGWKQEAWKDLNNKIYKLFNGTLHNLNYQSSYMKKTTTVSNSNLVSVITSDTAMDSVQSLQIGQLARAGYLTGAKLNGTNGKLSSGSKVVESLGITAGSKFEISSNGKATEITIDENTTISSLVSQLKSAGVNANFDAEQQRLFIGATETGKDHDFILTASNSTGTDALSKLGILVYDDAVKSQYEAYANMSAEDRQKLIDSRVSQLHKQYTSKKEALEKSNKGLNEKQAALLEDFETAYGGVELTDDTARTDRKSAINTRIAELEAEKEAAADGKLSAEKQSELDKLKGELSYIDGYEKNLDSIKKNDDDLAALVSDGYLTADGEAGAKLTDIATAEVDAKIATARDIVNNYSTLAAGSNAKKQAGEDCVVTLNGVDYTSSSNTIKVNGLSITCNGKTAPGEEITLTTKNDTTGIYDMIKGFIKEYSALINEMDKLYNAESSKGYEPLTDEEKEAMSESEVEKWETKIKDSLLRRDSTLSSVSSAMKEIMASGFEVNGRKMFLYDFGIETLGYFNAADNEKNAYHIAGDEDDEYVKNETNKLMEMINSDPDAVVGFFTQLSQSLYGKLNKLMGTSEYSSVNKVYDDKKMKEDYDSYTSKIKEAEKKLQDYEDKWYKKFSAMETAMAKMQSNASAVTSLLGGS